MPVWPSNLYDRQYDFTSQTSCLPNFSFNILLCLLHTCNLKFSTCFDMQQKAKEEPWRKVRISIEIKCLAQKPLIPVDFNLSNHFWPTYFQMEYSLFHKISKVSVYYCFTQFIRFKVYGNLLAVCKHCEQTKRNFWPRENRLSTQVILVLWLWIWIIYRCPHVS